MCIAVPPLQRSGMCIVDENLNFLAPAGRHVYSTQETQKS